MVLGKYDVPVVAQLVFVVLAAILAIVVKVFRERCG
jgi:hypothetical protein